jgi:hypothetical protein
LYLASQYCAPTLSAAPGSPGDDTSGVIREMGVRGDGDVVAAIRGDANRIAAVNR